MENRIFHVISLCLNDLIRASCIPSFGPAELFEFSPDEFVRKKLAALGNCSLRCSTTGTPDRYVPVGDPERSRQARNYGYASAGDSPDLFAGFPLGLVPIREHEGL